MQKKVVLLTIIVFCFGILFLGANLKKKTDQIVPDSEPEANPAAPLATPSPSPTPTPIPLTFEQMNERWGPCVRVPVLLYHHVQDLEEAKTEGHLWMTVSPATFEEQMLYLRDQGYQTIGPETIIAFFDQGTSLPSKAVLITFDDGYADLAVNAAPALRKTGLQALVFLPTGLMNNPGYLNWEQIAALKDVFSFGNHTWSHSSMLQDQEKVQIEITTADSQLIGHGLNNPKTFAYPMGATSSWSQQLLASLGYQLAFTTQSSSVLCREKRLALPRIRIGEASLKAYGF